jgi:glycosyltransferase involved in cell wall biosynthesis
MNVEIVYRNYKPLHALHSSLVTDPPEGIAFVFPKPRKSLRKFYPIYVSLGDRRLVKACVLQAQKHLFRAQRTNAVDLLHYLQMLPKSLPPKPFVVDFEHFASLADFLEVDNKATDSIRITLENPLCCRIIPLSTAAQKSLEYVYGELDSEFIAKIEVVYPALPNNYALFRGQADSTFVSPDNQTFRLLFVGNNVYIKGLHELLDAFTVLAGKYDDIELYIISDAPRRLTQKYQSSRIHYFEPRFSRHDIIRMFYLPCDLFVLPTHSDTFGMALLDALSCGTPVLTTEQFATPEIVRPWDNGLLVQSNRLYHNENPVPSRKTWKTFAQETGIEKDLVDELVAKIERLYFNRDLLRTMGQRAVQDFGAGGRFSIGVRNEKLSRIYRSCDELAKG